jgi:hypothetical protein
MSLTSYRAAPPRDQGWSICQAFGKRASFISGKIGFISRANDFSLFRFSVRGGGTRTIRLRVGV